MQYEPQIPQRRGQENFAESKTQFLQRTYGVMALGLLVTFAVSWLIAAYAPWIVFRPVIVILVTLAEVITVWQFSARIMTASHGAVMGMFLFFAALTGVVFASIFLLFEIGSIFLCFLASAAAFALTSVFGLRTARDLSPWRGMLFGGLIALLILTVLASLLRISALELLICCAGVVLFLGMAAYDSQRIGQLYDAAAGTPMQERLAIYGALQLYLDFVNLFQYVLLLFGRRRRN